MEIRKLNKFEIALALDLVWRTFLKFEAPDYTEEGINEFKKSIDDSKFIDLLEFYGAFEKNELLGVIAIRNNNHIALFFVDEKYHKQGIGKKLYNQACLINEDGYFTVNSSPYAKEVYEHLGFVFTDNEKIINGIKFYPMRKDLTMYDKKINNKQRKEQKNYEKKII